MIGKELPKVEKPLVVSERFCFIGKTPIKRYFMCFEMFFEHIY